MVDTPNTVWSWSHCHWIWTGQACKHSAILEWPCSSGQHKPSGLDICAVFWTACRLYCPISAVPEKSSSPVDVNYCVPSLHFYHYISIPCNCEPTAVCFAKTKKKCFFFFLILLYFLSWVLGLGGGDKNWIRREIKMKG